MEELMLACVQALLYIAQSQTGVPEKICNAVSIFLVVLAGGMGVVEEGRVGREKPIQTKQKTRIQKPKLALSTYT